MKHNPYKMHGPITRKSFYCLFGFRNTYLNAHFVVSSWIYYTYNNSPIHATHRWREEREVSKCEHLCSSRICLSSKYLESIKYVEEVRKFIYSRKSTKENRIPFIHKIIQKWFIATMDQNKKHYGIKSTEHNF